MNGTATRRQFTPQAARLGSFVRDRTAALSWHTMLCFIGRFLSNPAPRAGFFLSFKSSLSQGINPYHMMINAKALPAVEFADYTFVFR
jgi:hypothetical protein